MNGLCDYIYIDAWGGVRTTKKNELVLSKTGFVEKFANDAHSDLTNTYLQKEQAYEFTIYLEKYFKK